MVKRTHTAPGRNRRLTILRQALRTALSLSLIFLAIEFFDELHYALEGAVLPVIRLELALTYAQVGLLLGLPHLIGAFIEPALMLLGDTPIRKRLVIGGGVALSLSLVCFAGAQSFVMLLLASVLSYPASGAFVSLAQATLMDLNHGRESKLMARWSAAGSMGNLAGPLVVAAGFTLGLGWRWVFASLAGLAFLLTLALIPRPFPASQPAHQASPETEPIEASSHPRLGLSALFFNLWAALQNRGLLRWIILLEFSDLLLDVFTGYSALYFTDVVGLSPAQASLALSVLMVSSLVADLLLIVILERYPGRSVVRFSAAISIGVYITWLMAPWPAVKVLLLVAIRFSTMGWYPVLLGEAYAAAPGRSGTVMALNSLGSLFGGALIWLVGWAAGQAGLATAMWLLLLGPLCLVVFVPKAQNAMGDEKHYTERDSSTPV